MPTIKEMDEHLAYLNAWHQKCYDDAVVDLTERLENERNPYFRELFEERLAKLKRWLQTGRYD